jgi:hypothetical protein
MIILDPGDRNSLFGRQEIVKLSLQGCQQGVRIEDLNIWYK